MSKTILVPTDFSKNSLNAVEYASAIAKKEKAKIILLNAYHYIPPSSDIPLPSDIIHSMHIDSLEKLSALCSEIVKSKKIKCEFLSKFDLAVNAIIETSKEKKSDLIIMGTKGASGIREVLMGSNTASVIEKSKCPLIAVPEKAGYTGINNIMYASDYHESDIDALKKLVELARFFKSRIIVLHASDEEFNRFSEEEYLKIFKNRVQRKIRYNRISYKLAFGKLLKKVLQKEIEESNPDLIAMSTRHRNLFEKLFGTSVTRKMAFHSEIPLMAFHHKKESVVFV